MQLNTIPYRVIQNYRASFQGIRCSRRRAIRRICEGLTMPVEVFMRKRGARYVGERGLFIEQPVFEDDFNIIAMDGEVKATLSTEINSQMLKFVWALATKIAENSEV